MKVTGFSFIRNTIKYDYPIIEAIKSILPICDNFVLAVGKSDDETLEYVSNIDKEKITIIETVWDDSLRDGGVVLAMETDKAFQAISAESDWAFYIQGDEVVHEDYLDTIYQNMKKWKDDANVDGLLFNYEHFYGSYDYIGDSPRWYRREIRVVKNNKNIYSYRDAQGFRKDENKKLNVKLIDAYIYHYGWVKEPKAMQRKRESFSKLYHSDDWVTKNLAKAENFDYSGIDALRKFEGSHPKVMQERIEKANWKFDHDLSFKEYSLKNKFKIFVNNVFGFIPGEYRNYNKV